MILALNANIMEPMTRCPCDVCGGRMELWQGKIDKRDAVIMACTNCDQTIEV
jgi:hypothetical protein